MNKALTIAVAAAMMAACGTTDKETAVNIEKQTVTLESDQMTPEALWAMSRIAAYAASPDGSKVVFQVGYYSVKENKSHQVLWMMNADGSEQRQLTSDAQNETDPAWLDAETIAFIREGEVWSMKADGSARRQLSDTEGSVEGFKFAPTMNRVVLIKSMPFNDIIEARPDDLPLSTGRVVNDLMYRHWDHYVESIQHPFVADFDGSKISSEMTDVLEGEPYECPMEPFGGIEQLDFSPDGEQIAYTCRKKTGRAYSISTDSDIYLYTIGTRETRNLCKPADYKDPEVVATKTLRTQLVNSEQNLKNNPGYDQNPKFSPDGKYVAWLSMARDGYESDRQRLCCYDLATGEKQYLTETFDSNVDDFCWSDDEAALIYFIGVWHATENLYAVTKDMEVRQLSNEWADFGSLQMLNNGSQLLMERHSYTAPADLYVVTPNTLEEDEEMNVAEVKQITDVNKEILDQLAKPTVDQRWVKTTDGRDMLYWIILPPNFDETKKYPTLLFCEGGPQSPVSQFWSYRWNFFIMASQGYVIIAPNRHGLPGFGSEWCEQISGDWTGQCMQDYLTAIDDAAQNLPYVDRDRMGAVGASFGGFSVYYLAGHHQKRFKCFIAHDGAFNLEAMYTETEENWFSNWEYDDAYWNVDRTANASRTYMNSPHRYVGKWDTPILCIHGEKDYRINATQGMSAFNAARMQGVEAQLLIFPDENHWVLKPQNGILWQRTYFAWLDRWLKQ